MEDPNGAQPDRVQVRQARRPPAHESVTLRHYKPLINMQETEAAASPTSRRSTYAQADAPNLVIKKHSSDESTNAEEWFERWNHDVRVQPARSNDSDPPFLLPTSSEDSPVDPIPPICGKYLSHQRSIAPQLVQRITDDSSGDYRSVIDDLTIENKRLNKRLRRYERLHNSHLQCEQLFEVRTHGLPAEKKRELEEVLRTFSMDCASSSTKPSTPKREHYPARLRTKRTNASNDSGFAESAYVSMSASGQTSEGQSGRASGAGTHPQLMERSAHPDVTNILSCLLDTPEHLPARHTQAMTEKAKKELVVRRLEHIFAGRGARGAHQQPMQQQELSVSAALADRNAIEANGQRACKEGLREAPIMPRMLGDKQAINAFLQSGFTQFPADSAAPDDRQALALPMEQRPTRPIDLDPHRAQVAAENLEYMRHLGFSPDANEKGNGWIYINLLINMAQLHTVNVTGDFVREAVREYSDKLEMSQDGKKLRWKGGDEVTRPSSDAWKSGLYGAEDLPKDDNEDSEGRMRKRRRLGSEHSYNSEYGPRRPVNYPTKCDWASATRLAYNPPVFQRGECDVEDYMSSEDYPERLSGYFDKMTCNSSRLVSHGVSDSSPLPKHEEGPIIFYNRATFFTDLSGDRRDDTPLNNISYSKYPTRAVGMTRHRQTPLDAVQYLDPRGPMTDVASSGDPMQPVDADTPTINVPPYSPSSTLLAIMEPNNREFEASGIGGVKPCDHFAVNVQVRRSVWNSHEQLRDQRAIRPSRKFSAILVDHDKELASYPTLHLHDHVSEEIIATEVKQLPPSTLPQPNYFFTLDDDEDGLDDDNLSMSSVDMCSDIVPLVRTHPVNLSSEAYAVPLHSSAGSDEDSTSGDYHPEDESLDFLATAREVDPDTIWTREREYDSDVAERLAEQISAGSRATAAGGAVGFNSLTCPVVSVL